MRLIFSKNIVNYERDREDVWNSDSDDSIGSECTSEHSNENTERIKKEATKAFKKWRVFYDKIDWKYEFSNMDLPSGGIQRFEYLVYCNMGVLYQR